MNIDPNPTTNPLNTQWKDSGLEATTISYQVILIIDVDNINIIINNKSMKH